MRVIHKVGPVDRAALSATVDGVQPRGYTPIGHSLRVAAAELPAEGRRSIVLVSDGEDTCAPPDPCEVARELAERGVDLRVHAVGFAVDGRARQQLACLARATGGTYVDAPDATTLASALNRVTQQALRAYQPVGTPVTGTKTPDGAPALRPGAYLDRIGIGESRYYVVDVPAGYTLHATATGVMPAGNEFFLRVIRYDGEECTRPASSGATTTRAPVVSAALRWDAPPAAGAATRPCDRAGQQVVRVWLDPVWRSGRTTGDAALEVLIGLEPPVAGDGGQAATKDRAVFTAPTGPARPVVGGGSFSTAATLDGSGAHTDTVVDGLPSDGPLPVPMILDVSVTGDTQPAPGYAGGAGTDPFGDLSAAGRHPGAAGESAGGVWSTVADAGPLLWFGLPLLMLLSLGGLLVAVVTIRRRATRRR